MAAKARKAGSTDFAFGNFGVSFLALGMSRTYRLILVICATGFNPAAFIIAAVAVFTD